MTGLFLIEPDKKYQKSFENYALAYRKANDEHYCKKYKKALEDFNYFLNILHNYSRGNIPQGEVITSTFWLIAGKEVVGVVRIRHTEVKCAGHIGYDISPDHRHKGYGFQILKLALVKAANIGIEDVILTCNIDNLASKKIIEKNGGELLGIIFDEEENEYLYKYRIKNSDIFKK